MDSNISDLLGGVLANPEMMSKVKTLLPLVSQMMKSDAPLVVQPAAAAPAEPPPQAQADNNIMANADVASALQNLIAAISSANQPVSAPTVQPPEAVPVFAQQPTPVQSEPVSTQQSEAANSINIEKTLDTLKNVTNIASPENDHRAKLLLSLKPFLGESRRTKIDTAIKYINAAKIFSSFGKNGFV